MTLEEIFKIYRPGARPPTDPAAALEAERKATADFIVRCGMLARKPDRAAKAAMPVERQPGDLVLEAIRKRART